MDWNQLFGLQVPVVEILVRGSCIYWFLFLLFRFVIRRDVGSIGIADILLLVIVADAAQNAMAGDYKSITEGMLLVGTIVAWNMLLDWAAFRWASIDRFVRPRVVMLVRHGCVLHENLARERISLDELQAKLRLQGVDGFAQVRHAMLESDGEISVIKR